MRLAYPAVCNVSVRGVYGVGFGKKLRVATYGVGEGVKGGCNLRGRGRGYGLQLRISFVGW